MTLMPRSRFLALRQVLHVKAVTHCAVLEQFSLFLVLSNKVSDVSIHTPEQEANRSGR